MELDSAAPSDAAVARIMDVGGQPAGAGFLTRRNEVVTCAHVVAMALGLRRDVTDRPTGQLWVDFPLTEPSLRVEARIESWTPVGADGSGDIAVLRLLTDAPPKARVARLVENVAGADRRVRTFGFPDGYADGTWSVGWLRGRQGTGWLQYDTDPASQHRVERGFSGAPVWDVDEGGVVGMVVAVDSGPSVRTAYLIPTEKLRESWSSLADASLTACPFRSLESFQERDARLFHGRDEPARQIVDLLGHAPVTSLVGPSGSGKSSLLYAGVLPRLRERAPDLEVVSFRPGQLGRTPLTALALALLPLLEADLTETARLAELPGLTELLRQGQMPAIVDRVLARQGKQRLLVIADQFEEALLDFGQADLDPLAGALAYSLQTDSRLRVLISLRADFLTSALNHPMLVPLLGGDRLFTVGAMSDSELRAAVVRPLETSGVVYEPGLVDRILSDLGTDPGRLPLLEFTLTKLWERQQRGVINHAAYEALGRVNDALVNHAEQVWTSGLTEEEHSGARALLVQLVHPADGRAPTRRTVARSELPPDQWRIAQRLMSTRLVVPGEEFRPGGGPPEETVELAHETLLTQWRRLREFVEADHEFRSWQESVRRRIVRWESRKRGRPGLLSRAELSSAELREARTWRSRREHELSPAEKAFIEAAARWARRRLLALTAMVTSVALLAGLFFWMYRKNTHEDAAGQASRVLAQQSRDAQESTTSGGSYTALLLALRAYRTQDTAETRALVGDMYGRYGFADLVVPRYMSTASLLTDLTGSPPAPSATDTAGRVIVSTAADGEVVVWRSDGSGVTRLPTGRNADITAVSQDGSLVAMAQPLSLAAGQAPDVRGKPALVYDTTTRKVIELERPQEGDAFPEFDDDGLPPELKLADFSDIQGFRMPTQYVRFAFAPGNKLLIGQTGFYGKGGRFVIWDLTDGRIQKILPGPRESVTGIWVHSDGKSLVTLSQDYKPNDATTHGAVKLWDLGKAAPKQQSVFTWTNASGVTATDVSPDLTRLAIVEGRTDGLKVTTTVTVHELPSGKRVSRERLQTEEVPDGVAVAAAGGPVRTYSLAPWAARPVGDPVPRIGGSWQKVDLLGAKDGESPALLFDPGLIALVGPDEGADAWSRLPQPVDTPGASASPSQPAAGMRPKEQMRHLCRILGDETLPPAAEGKLPPGAYRGALCS
ncbi:trypsin-like peptidase domain-containing protein [Streptomyces sp. NPDC018000]|uniref:nSTAND1 domain-containing NTPase n=1 Tax=Streptomyces sp. NPDC018000 TaxID=3365028 RepID=UPI0037B14611